MEAIIFVGLPGSGKSSFYKERFFNSHVRISLDLLKTRQYHRALKRPPSLPGSALWQKRALFCGRASVQLSGSEQLTAMMYVEDSRPSGRSVKTRAGARSARLSRGAGRHAPAPRRKAVARAGTLRPDGQPVRLVCLRARRGGRGALAGERQRGRLLNPRCPRVQPAVRQ